MDYLKDDAASKRKSKIEDFYWSSCSVDDLKKFYNQQKLTKNEFCLEDNLNTSLLRQNEFGN